MEGREDNGLIPHELCRGQPPAGGHPARQLQQPAERLHPGGRRPSSATPNGCTAWGRTFGLDFFLGRHPHLAEFTASPGTTLFMVTVTCISQVTRFQQVMDLDLS